MAEYNVPQLLLDQRERLEPKLKEIGDTWEDCLRVVSHTTAHNLFAGTAGKAEWGKEIVLMGCTDGGYLGVKHAIDLLAKKDGLTLVISGGVYDKVGFTNEVGAFDLYDMLCLEIIRNRRHLNGIFKRVIIDSISQHTGHQRIILGPLLTSLAPDNVWVVIPTNHITRFIMTTGLLMYENGFRTNIIPWPYGSWNDAHTRKGPLDNPDRKFKLEELFALPPTPSVYEGRFYCGEIDKIIQYAHPSERQCLTFRQAREWLGI